MASASKKKNPFLGGFLVGLFTGLALAVAVALLVTRSNPFVEKAPGQAGTGAAPAAPAEAPKFEFYQAPLEDRPDSASAAPRAPAAAPAPRAIYFLQTGAFGNVADAEEEKARLALLGFEARISSVQEGTTMLHKVRTGPYKSMDELNTDRARLTQNGVETMLVKIALPQEEKR